MTNRLEILFEDNHLLVVNKPAGVATQGALPGQPSLVEDTRGYLKRKYAKPGNVYVGVVSRLDSQVSGVVVLARTSKAAARLTSQFASGAVEKTYVAIVKNDLLTANDGELVHFVWKDDSAHRMRASREQSPDSQVARLLYRTIGQTEALRLLEITLLTGRKHQIRLQLSEIGLPIIGDSKYGSKERFAKGVALHSKSLSFEHPTRKERLNFQCLPPNYWNLEQFSVH